MPPRRLTCRELDAFLAAWLDDELGRDERRAFERHLRACRPCLAYVAGYRAAVRLGRLAFDPRADAEADAPRELIDEILALRRS